MPAAQLRPTTALILRETLLMSILKVGALRAAPENLFAQEMPPGGQARRVADSRKSRAGANRCVAGVAGGGSGLCGGHFPHRLLLGGLSPGQAALATIGLIPAGLFLGFVMLRTRNIVASGILHTFINFS